VDAITALAQQRPLIALHLAAALVALTMQGLFFGACLVAGLFTLLPGRFFGRLLWHDLLRLSG
jgi:hypothetical protein